MKAQPLLNLISFRINQNQAQDEERDEGTPCLNAKFKSEAKQAQTTTAFEQMHLEIQI
jgi:hypothetical protein